MSANTVVARNAGKRWSTEDDELLIENAPKLSHQQLATMFGRTPLAIRLRLLGKLHAELVVLKFFDDPVGDEDEREAYSNMLDAMLKYGNPTYDEVMTFHYMGPRRQAEHHAAVAERKITKSERVSVSIANEKENKKPVNPKVSAQHIVSSIAAGINMMNENDHATLSEVNRLLEQIVSVLAKKK
jgi:hypothetical protein